MNTNTKDIQLQEEGKLQIAEAFASVIGYESVKQELYQLCDSLKNPSKYQKLGTKSPKGLLLHGEPGLGKTLMANCFISALGRKTFICRKDSSNGKFIDYIKKIFEDADKNTPSLIFLDDMDKFANEDANHRNAEEYVTIQSMIDTYKNKDIFVIATVNDMFSLPTSLIRVGRFDKTIEIKAPKGKDAVDIVKYYISQKNYVAELDFEEIAKILDGRSCAELESVINEAGIIAGYQNKEKIDMDDMINACLRVIFDAPQDQSFLTPTRRKMVAIHEAGHAIVQEMLEPNSTNLVSILCTSGTCAGITSYLQHDDYWLDIKYMENRIKCLLAGRAATEIKLGTVDTGAGQDIDRAFAITERIVTKYNNSGFDKITFTNRMSENFLQRKENEIFSQMNQYYQQTKKLILDNIEFLDKIIEQLLEKETLLRKDIQKIKSNKTLA